MIAVTVETVDLVMVAVIVVLIAFKLGSLVAFVALPGGAPFNGAYEVVTTGPVQQRIQPGMALRIAAIDPAEVCHGRAS